MGGTEATVLRVSETLAGKSLHSVYIEQHNRTNPEAWAVPLGYVQTASSVICLRSPISLINARKRFPNAKLYLWCHDLPNAALGQCLGVIEETKADLICVSNWHRASTVDVLRAFGYTGQFKIKVIYNPIDDNLKPDSTPVDRNKLVWLSSPHKGVEYAIDLFRSLKEFNKDFSFYVLNPGYADSRAALVGVGDLGIHWVGASPHNAGIEHLRSSLCLFYPGNNFPETFGLVFAEANAVGTPVIAHRHGAATEILDHPSETLDCHNRKSVIDRVMKWYNGERPIVRGKPQFRLSNVIKQWEELLK